MSTPEAAVAAAMMQKREAGGAAPADVPDVPDHSEAMGSGREVYPPGQRGDADA